MDRRALILAGAVVLAGCSSHATPRVVPWLDERLPAYRTPPAQLVRYRVNARSCSSAQLRLRFSRDGAATGHYFQELDVTNVGSNACVVRGNPTLTAVDARGSRVTVRPSPNGTFFGQLLAANVAPAGHVYIDLETTDICPTPAKRYGHVALVLPDGVVSSHVSISVDCGLAMSRIGLPERYAAPPAARGSVGTLAARIVLPAAVAHGATLRYTVVLRNPTPRPVRLEPCPGYTQGLFARRAFVRVTERLNCRRLTTLAPHARQRYAMQISVPRGASGVAKIGWSLDTPNGPFAGGAVRVR